jgi:RHS repeat-associated protein
VLHHHRWNPPRARSLTTLTITHTLRQARKLALCPPRSGARIPARRRAVRQASPPGAAQCARRPCPCPRSGAGVPACLSAECAPTCNAENRLIAAAPTFAQSGDARVSFAYDYLGRRVLKVVEQYDGSTWAETARRKFIWSGWLMLMELDCGTGVPPVDDAVVRKYTWGLDLAGLTGSMGLRPVNQAPAGGIGGLVGIYDADATPGPAGGDGNYAVLHDANGNVTQLVAWASTVQDDSETALGSAWTAARIVAHYEYGPYGNVLNDLSGQVYAAENPWRFSTKQFDPETGLGYWGYRYYSPTLVACPRFMYQSS